VTPSWTSWSLAWLALGAVLQVIGVALIARQVYATATRFGSPPTRLTVFCRRALRQLARARRFIHRPRPVVHQLSASGTATATGSARINLLRATDTPTEAEFRRRIEDLEVKAIELESALRGQDARHAAAVAATAAVRSEVAQLATSGLLVQGWNVVLVAVGIALSVAAPWLGEVDVRGLPALVLLALAFLFAPSRLPASPTSPAP
jgi:hypothetical protein